MFQTPLVTNQNTTTRLGTSKAIMKEILIMLIKSKQLLIQMRYHIVHIAFAMFKIALLSVHLQTNTSAMGKEDHNILILFITLLSQETWNFSF